MARLKLLIILTFIPVIAWSWQWQHLWKTQDQMGSQLLQAGQPHAAAQTFKNKDWQAVAHYRSGNYEQAYQQFSANPTSDSQYNAGNAAAHLGRFQEAIASYDKAIALNPNHHDAIANKEIVEKLLKQQQQQQNQQQQQQQKNQQQNQQNQNQQKNEEKSQQQNNPKKEQNDQNNKKEQKKPDQDQKQNQSQNQDKQKEQQKDQKSKSDPQSASSNMSQPKPNKNDNKTQAFASQSQKQDENHKQLLRRVVDEPGGLLQQKFLRDYLRRHSE